MTATSILSPVKFCKKCQCATERYNNGSCRPCRLASCAPYRASNPEKVQAGRDAWTEQNKDKIKETRKAYRDANHEKLNALQSAWVKANPDRVKAMKERHRATAKYKETNSRYAAENIDRNRAKNRAWINNNRDAANRIYHTRRAKKAEAGGVLSKGLAAKLLSLQRGKCACCGLPLGGKYHLDHILPIALGGTNTDDNIQLLRAVCNHQKHAKHPVDFMQSRGFLL